MATWPFFVILCKPSVRIVRPKLMAGRAGAAWLRCWRFIRRLASLKLSRTPLGRLGEPLDVDDAVVHLCTPAAKFVTDVVWCRRLMGGRVSGFKLRDHRRRSTVFVLAQVGIGGRLAIYCL